jgi:uncharacterized protein (TIGR00299 family) protein
MLAYFDCFSGISGDMTLGALIDLGVPLQWLKDRLRSIPLTDFDITATAVHRNGIHATSARVDAFENKTSRNFSEIRRLIQDSPLQDTVKSTGVQIFEKLAKAEARIHSCSPEEVHFHEVGGIDAIVDIVGTALCLDYLGIKKILASRIPLGKGFVTSRHGKIPIPAPATVAILEDVPVYGANIPHELVTPTGAAIIVTLAQSFESLPDMVIKQTGYGAGQRDLEERPNLLRVIMGFESESVTDLPDETRTDKISILETCIDDMSPEVFGYLMDRLFEDGALDVYWIPIHMKKNRPGTMLQVLCKNEARDVLIHRILLETTTLGVRYYESNRRLLWRDNLDLKTVYGTISVKRVKDPQGNVRIVPEYEVCRKIALEKDIPLRTVYDTLARQATEED